MYARKHLLSVSIIRYFVPFHTLSRNLNLIPSQTVTKSHQTAHFGQTAPHSDVPHAPPTSLQPKSPKSTTLLNSEYAFSSKNVPFCTNTRSIPATGMGDMRRYQRKVKESQPWALATTSNWAGGDWDVAAVWPVMNAVLEEYSGLENCKVC